MGILQLLLQLLDPLPESLDFSDQGVWARPSVLSPSSLSNWAAKEKDTGWELAKSDLT